MAHRTTLTQEQPAKAPKGVKKPSAGAAVKTADSQERERIFDAFRRWGYLEANLDPLGMLQPLKHPDLDGLSGEVAEDARRIYCGTVGADFMHLPEPDRRQWIIERLEARASASLLLHARVGVVVPKYRRNVVERNRTKRQLRELARTIILPVAGRVDVLLRAKPEAYGASFDQLTVEVDTIAQWVAGIALY